MRVLVPVTYNHSKGIDVIFRVAEVAESVLDEELPEIADACYRALYSAREEMIREFGEEEVRLDEEYGGFDTSRCLEDGEKVTGVDGVMYRIRLERADAPLMSKEELASRNKSGSACAACGGRLRGPYPGMLYCPDCEG
jgi:hypothetical protein